MYIYIVIRLCQKYGNPFNSGIVLHRCVALPVTAVWKLLVERTITEYTEICQTPFYQTVWLM